MIIKIPFIAWDIKLERQFPVRSTCFSKTDIQKRKYNKVFCIGANKTGTTSLEKLLTLFGFKMGEQSVAEILSLDWLANKNTERIIKYCHTADAFQDVPFSYPGLHEELDKFFPHSKFILTVRNNADEWFNSLVKFHTKVFSSNSDFPPSADDLSKSTYRYQGYALDVFRLAYNYPEVALYDETTYKNHYVMSNEEKKGYFKDRPNDFIEINLAVKDDFHRLCDFLDVETTLTDFPWLNES